MNDTALVQNRNKHAAAKFSYTTDSGIVVSVELTGTETVANFDIDTDPGGDDDDDEKWYVVAGIVVGCVVGVVLLIYGACVW